MRIYKRSWNGAPVDDQRSIDYNGNNGQRQRELLSSPWNCSRYSANSSSSDKLIKREREGRRLNNRREREKESVLSSRDKPLDSRGSNHQVNSVLKRFLLTGHEHRHSFARCFPPQWAAEKSNEQVDLRGRKPEWKPESTRLLSRKADNESRHYENCK